MKHHIVVKLHRPLPDDSAIPDWVNFIQDKSVVRETLNPTFDRIMAGAGLKFWVTREYQPAAGPWDEAERAQGLHRTYRVILQEDYRVPVDLLQRITALPEVENARDLEIGEVRMPSGQLATQTSVAPGGAADLIFLPYARAITRGSPDVRIAILDTGVDLEHPELKGKIAKGADFVNLEGLDTTEFIGDFKDYDSLPTDEVGHGSHVAGIIAARGERMDEGVAPDCSLMAVRVLATMRSGNRRVGAGIVDNINTGIKWAVDNGADVINMSLGIKHVGGGLPHEDVIRYALSKNVTVVAASGNDGTRERYYPGALPGVIAVGAVDGNGHVTSFTSYGANITVVAPGLNIYSSYANGGYAAASGTSQASPFVCGAVALLRSFAREQGRRLGNRDINFILKSTSDKVDSRLRDEHAGYGLLNLADAFKLLIHQLH